ncbi:MAG TPA: hypothetical protein DCZ97_13875 [Syntrophus sp. (in: bacteria)]|nr:MAG: hypothetical protein A2X92_06155 [Syntrophus sp. GWC2_56_31]HBB18026.1 hypothetical protein [Syntrophus sp. (in: bacteria)]
MDTNKTILLIATLDTKEEEAFYLKARIEKNRIRVLLMDTGILAPPVRKPDISQEEVAAQGGVALKTSLQQGDKFASTENMCRGAARLTASLFHEGRIQGVIGIGGGQGTQIATTAMRALPTGIPGLMVSTIANGLHRFGPYVGTRDLTIMHTVCDIQGLNFLTRRILQNAAGAICGMVLDPDETIRPEGVPVALSMLGTTTIGALRAKRALQEKGYEVVSFHQNGTGGIAMEDMILGGAFDGVLDLNLHEIGDYRVKGLHAALRGDRLTAAGALGLPQVVAPGSINYSVQGPPESIPEGMAGRARFYNNPQFTLVRLGVDELKDVAREVASKLNRARGPVMVFIPLKGFSYPDREGLPHWDPEGNEAFIDTLESSLSKSIPLVKLDTHINDAGFIDAAVAAFLSLMAKYKRAPEN